MGYFISEDCKDLLKDVHAFCENEMKEQVYEAEKLSYADPHGGDEIINGILGGLHEMGLTQLAIPEELGGPGLSRIDRAALVEEISKYDSGIGITLMANELALDSLEVAGNDEQKKHCYDILINGGYGCFCLTEPNAGCDVSAATTVAVEDGDDYIINGTKCFITNGPIADFFVVYAITDKEVPSY